MKAVLMSIKPRWCELIASGKKTVEVRKTKPKLEVPFKVYIYCTADRRKHIADTFVPQTPLFVKNGMAKSSIGREDGFPWKLGNGKVIGEFVCDSIYPFHYELSKGFYEPREFLWGSCLSLEQLKDYVGGSLGYAWHISNLVIYDKPMWLEEFRRSCPDDVYSCAMCRHGDYTGMRCTPFTRPPQSWCYVEEVNDG